RGAGSPRTEDPAQAKSICAVIRVTMIFFVIVIFYPAARAQYWRTVGLGTIGPTYFSTVFGDSVSDRLLAGGTFTQLVNEDDTIAVYGIAGWNGTRWDSVATRLSNSVDQTYWFLRYQGQLFACGAFSFMDANGVPNSRIARFANASMQWDNLGCPNPLPSGLGTLVPKEPGADLYITGFKNSLCGHAEAAVFRYNGVDIQPWSPFGMLFIDVNDYVGYVFEFRGVTYMSGSFNDPLGSGYTTFLRWDGVSWGHVPAWGNVSSSIKDISIRNDTLYVAGSLRIAQGAPGNGVAFFDGSTWNDMGGGVRRSDDPGTTIATVLQWYRNDLYVSGGFDEAGGIPVDMIAKWNGRQWCSLPGDFDWYGSGNIYSLNDMTVWRDSLFVCGYFNTIDGEPFGQVAQWIGGDAVQDCSAPVGVREVAVAPAFVVHPNPTTGQLHVDLQGIRPREVRLTDALGRVVLQQSLSGRQVGPVNLDLGALASGTYQVTVVATDGMRHTRTVVRE
ncbi:MAG: T9SS type A sorting domain-containing protein, partial [Flavobacteriales bacterium]|nr:T9SS type A sorting domain-containing protein [Flavobacteriales bacterium]